MAKKTKIYFSPTSSEAVETIYRLSNDRDTPIGLIIGLKQIHCEGGYLNNWRTITFTQFCKKLKEIYPKAQVTLCRGHCGPEWGYENYLKNTLYDIKHGIKEICVDFSQKQDTYKHKLDAAAVFMDTCLKLDDGVTFEICMTANIGKAEEDIDRVGRELRFFTNVGPIDYFIVNTGSLVIENKQVGMFMSEYVGKVKKVLNQYKVSLKEIHGDFSKPKQIQERHKLVDAMNITFEIEQAHIGTLLDIAYQNDIDHSAFSRLVYDSGLWKSHTLERATTPNIAAYLAGHYYIGSYAYQQLLAKIIKKTNKDISKIIRRNLEGVILKYLENL